MTAKIINGRAIAQVLRNDVASELKTLLKTSPVSPLITSITVGHNPSSDLYLKLRENACKEVGIRTNHLYFEKNIREKQIMETIHQLNNDPSVHGIFIQYPLPTYLSQANLIRAIHPNKDVEGLHPYNLGATYLGDERLTPCTPQAVLTILKHEQVSLQGKDIVIVNHSTIVGKPLAGLLLQRNATVSICHVYTKDLKRYSSQADILITAAGVPKLITGEHVKKHAVVIDVAVIETKDGVCGDVDTTSVVDKADLLTPVPGGVGPVTIACSLKNMVQTYKTCMGQK